MRKEDIIIAGLSIFSFVTTIAAIVCADELRRASNVLDTTTEKLVSKDIDISDELVEKIVEKAVDREASYHIRKSLDKAADKIADRYESEIKTAIEEEMKIQRSDLEKTLKKKIGNVDISEIKRKVMAEAKDACMEKIKDDLDELSDKYTEQVESMASIYETVANKIQSIGD